MRGTLNIGQSVPVRQRFIPAHAGNTFQSCPRDCPPAVHPRACGEHLDCPCFSPVLAGSSPRMRGTRCRRSTNPRQSSVHPRACGEHLDDLPAVPHGAGSSPRMRGTLATLGQVIRAQRFIPAHAGNTPVRRTGCGPRPVHPRACGEHATWAARFSGERRFIPAHAGNT